MKKRNSKSTWQALREIPVEIRISGDYFELRGRLPLPGNIMTFLKILEKKLTRENISERRKKEKPSKDKYQIELRFNQNIPWKQIPLLGKKYAERHHKKTGKSYRDAG